MEAVRNLSGRKTVIMIAHRLSTVQNCDRIFVLEKGQIAASGSYSELLETSEAFRALAEAGSS
jgi:ABC-type multidrug transport system fused ATPase/permease subunit